MPPMEELGPNASTTRWRACGLPSLFTSTEKDTVDPMEAPVPAMSRLWMNTSRPKHCNACG
eukprot:CAMPEP_0180535408 /NCGR_PEP_ID=MMETSP1036_2-20121128/64717_1 /TAXON_ID=632150 /ORGANISM="Azadinium spinosum, Strain 3D9" /LENGTH=60 /DNA_ID=CAMNT_0022549835 /DNA_START=195 /DNA_END=374 /DNA_ORIENTATION=+